MAVCGTVWLGKVGCGNDALTRRICMECPQDDLLGLAIMLGILVIFCLFFGIGIGWVYMEINYLQ